MEIRPIATTDIRADYFDLMSEVESGSEFDHQNPVHVEWLEHKISRRIGSGGLFFGLYTPEGDPVGFYSLLIESGLFSPGHAEVLDLGIRKPWRRQGHALSLLRDAEARAIEAGACCLHLQTFAGDEAAVSLYRKAGFKPVAEMPGLNGPDERGQLLLHKTLRTEERS